MTNYAIFIDGENFLLNLEGEDKRFGFFVTKNVRSECESRAIESAIASIKSDPKFAQAYERSHLVEPTLTVKVVHILDKNNVMSDTGYTFYPMEDQ